MKVAFLDRDGTIIEDYEDQAWRSVQKPVFLPNAIEGLKLFRHLGYELIVITNQYLIGENIITLEQYNKITELMVNELKNHGVSLLEIFYCPHSRSTKCSCRKPATGMIDAALLKNPTIQLPSSFIAGDSIVDIELGNKMGIRTFSLKAEANGLNYVKVNNLLDIAMIAK